MQKIVIIGNSGSGKSTMALALSREHGLTHLDLDTLAWEPVIPPRRRLLTASLEAMAPFFAANENWVVEGCYADLIEAALARCSRLIFLNPGIEACVSNCRTRPWEPHKYSSPEAQNENLKMLLRWVRDYETRQDEFSLASHRRLFTGFQGEKIEITSRAAAGSAG